MTKIKRTRRGGTSDRLAEYRKKRSADRTPEPFASPGSWPARLFVVQKHAARRVHYDLRLEMNGTLHSWAVPKGPSLDPADKRLAVEVEDHPLEYAEFEGIIPEGNYGAGAVIVWDRGVWDPVEDPDEGLRRGKLLFDLRGFKLRGRWTLFRTKGKPDEWLLMKKPDAEARPGELPPDESILSGLTVEQMAAGVDPAERIRSRLEQLGAPPLTERPERLGFMLARAAPGPFSDPQWLFELKYDGYRILAIREGDEASLRYRRGFDAAAVFPEITAALRALPYRSLVLDGELVVLDAEGRPSFQRLQRRVHLTRQPDVRLATMHSPATLFVFDLLAFEDRDLRPLRLSDRKEVLRLLLPQAGPLRYSDHVEEQGEALFEQVEKLALEGLVAKKADSPYAAERSAAWLKIRADRAGDFVVVGCSPAKGSRTGFGSLHLAGFDGDRLVYVGRVGSGFDARQLEEIHAALEDLRRPEPACSGAVPAGGEHTWVEPRLVCEVRYKQWTKGGLLRQPVFLRMRPDKPPEECPHPGVLAPAPEPSPPSEAAPVPRTVSITNPQKVFWPENGYTKGDLIEYYRSIAPWLLPYLKDRPVVLTRYPDGIHGKNFFQKDAPGFVPSWVRTERSWSEHAGREIHYFICDDIETLLYVANLATIPLHLWSSRVSSLQHPDWCILDLDPKEAPFSRVVRVAHAIRALCEEIGIPSFVKTSGSTGLHVLLPLGGQCTYEHSRTLGQVLARVIAQESPKLATVARSPAARGGRVYIDYVQNGHGRLLVAPFSVRPLPGAPVSTPLVWSEVRERLDIRRFTIVSVPARMNERKEDPVREVLQVRPDLEEVLARLAERLDVKGRGR